MLLVCFNCVVQTYIQYLPIRVIDIASFGYLLADHCASFIVFSLDECLQISILSPKKLTGRLSAEYSGIMVKSQFSQALATRSL